MNEYCAITFLSTHAAITAQELLDGVCPYQVMPVLREISRGCGISLRISPENLDIARSVLTAGLPPEQFACYAIFGSGHNLSAQLIP